MRRLTPLALMALLAACGGGSLRPFDFDAAHEACRFCRMTGSDGRTAAQLVAPGEEPLFFDDIGCLRDYLRQAGSLADDAGIYVADHTTRAWIRAERAVFTRAEGIATPMGSHLLAHTTPAARDADPEARAGTVVSFNDVFAGIAFGGSR